MELGQFQNKRLIYNIGLFHLLFRIFYFAPESCKMIIESLNFEKDYKHVTVLLMNHHHHHRHHYQ